MMRRSPPVCSGEPTTIAEGRKNTTLRAKQSRQHREPRPGPPRCLHVYETNEQQSRFRRAPPPSREQLIATGPVPGFREAIVSGTSARRRGASDVAVATAGAAGQPSRCSQPGNLGC